MSFKLPAVIGLPPSTWASDSMIDISMPVMEITPGIPEFRAGLSLFNLKPSLDVYKKILLGLGFELGSDTLKVAFLADNFPTDTFTNEYGEGMFQKSADVIATEASGIMQYFGASSITDLMKSAGEAGEKQGGVLGGMGTVVKGAANKFQGMIDSAKESGGMLGKMGGLVNKTLAGARVDFPQVWKNSGFTPSYSMTVRLYNPKPYSADVTNTYITGPIAALLLCGLPRSGDGDTYNWPFFHEIKCPGIYNLSPAYISNIAVIKGGDQQSIAYNQRLGIVDVRIDFGSLYGSILVDVQKKTTKGQTRPTLRKYLATFQEEKTIEPPNRKTGPPGIGLTKETKAFIKAGKATASPEEARRKEQKEKLEKAAKKLSKQYPGTSIDEKTYDDPSDDRVKDTDKSVSNDLSGSTENKAIANN